MTDALNNLKRAILDSVAVQEDNQAAFFLPDRTMVPGALVLGAGIGTIDQIAPSGEKLVSITVTLGNGAVVNVLVDNLVLAASFLFVVARAILMASVSEENELLEPPLPTRH